MKILALIPAYKAEETLAELVGKINQGRHWHNDRMRRQHHGRADMVGDGWRRAFAKPLRK